MKTGETLGYSRIDRAFRRSIQRVLDTSVYSQLFPKKLLNLEPFFVPGTFPPIPLSSLTKLVETPLQCPP